MERKKIKKEYLFALAAVLAWGSNAPVCKAVMGGISEELLLFLSATLSFLLLLIIKIFGKKPKEKKKYKASDILKIALFGFIGIFLYTYFYYLGLSRMPAAEACTINYLWPLMIVVFSIPILKEKFTVKKLFAVLLSFLGIVFVTTHGDFSGIASINFSGVTFCLLAAVCYGLFCVLLKKYAYDETLVLCIAYLITAVLAGIICAVGGKFTEIQPEYYVGILWNGLIVDAAAYLLWAKGLNAGDTSKISNLAYLAPVLSVIFGKIFLNEDISLWSVAGLLLIIAGILIQSVAFGKREKNI